MTPETRRALALDKIHPDFEKFLAHFAENNLVIVRTSEFKRSYSSDEPCAKDLARMKEFLKKIPGFSLDSHMNSARNYSPEAHEEVRQARLKNVFNALNSGATSTIPFLSDKAHLIVYNDERPLMDVLGRFAGLPKELLANIPDPSGDGKKAFFLLHEAAHVKLSHESHRNKFFFDLTGDTLADAAALSAYFRLMSMGAILDRNEPELWENLRAIAALRGSKSYLNSDYNDHATNLGFNVKNGRIEGDKISSGQAKAGVLTVNTRAYALLGAFEDQENKARSEVLDKESQDPQSNYSLYFTDAPNGRQAAYYLLAGRVRADERPLDHYAAVKALYVTGAFHDPAARTAAREFIEGFEKRVPSCHTDARTVRLLQILTESADVMTLPIEAALKSVIEKAGRDAVNSISRIERDPPRVQDIVGSPPKPVR